MASSLNSFTTCKVVIKVKIFRYSKRVATLPGEIFAIFYSQWFSCHFVLIKKL